MTVQLITSLHLWRCQTKMMLPLAESAVMCPKRATMGKTNITVHVLILIAYFNKPLMGMSGQVGHLCLW